MFKFSLTEDTIITHRGEKLIINPSLVEIFKVNGNIKNKVHEQRSASRKHAEGIAKSLLMRVTDPKQHIAIISRKNSTDESSNFIRKSLIRLIDDDKFQQYIWE